MTQEHRSTIRVSVELPCLIAYEGKEYPGRITDISLGGARLIMQQPRSEVTFQEDTDCAIRFDTRWGIIEAKCFIARVSGEQPALLGVKFKEMSSETEAVFQSLVNDLIRNNLAQASNIASLGNLFAAMTNQLNSPINQNHMGVSHLQDLTKDIQRDFDNKVLDEKQLERFLTELKSNFDQLAENVDKIRSVMLSFRAVSIDQAQQSTRSFKLPDYLEDILRTLQTAADEHKITTAVTCENSFELTGYPGAFAQMISQLFTNACLHAFDGANPGQVTIAVSQDGEVVDLRFIDNGAGMPDEIKSHIFSPYFTTRSDDGSTGLGLNIVSRIVQDVFGGEISCESTPGEGTTFLIRFPLVAPTAKATSAVSLLPQNFWSEFASDA